MHAHFYARIGACFLLAFAAGCANVGTSPSKEVKVEAMGPVAASAAPGQSLWLVRYEIPPGTTLKKHFHEGAQIGLVASGTLTYTVLTGEVQVFQLGPDGKSVEEPPVRAGETRTFPAGYWLVEEPEDHHYGANLGPEPLVIFTSSLLRDGAPLATPLPQ